MGLDLSWDRCGTATCVFLTLPSPDLGQPRKHCDSQWARLDSNQGPTDYESAALTN
jgi:hypothetical protein